MKINFVEIERSNQHYETVVGDDIESVTIETDNGVRYDIRLENDVMKITQKDTKRSISFT